LEGAQVLHHADCHSQLVADDGRRFPIALGRSTVGREVDCQMRLTDPTVGRHHATLDASPTSVTVTDLQSTNGTWVNDRRVDPTDLVALRHGDILRFGATRLHFVEPATATGIEHTTVMESGPSAQPQTPVHGTPQVAVGNQNAEQLNNVIGSQYNQYLKTVIEQRDSFLRDVAASRTRAKRLIWFGFFLFVVGGGAYLWMIIRFISETSELGAEDAAAFDEVWGEEIGGIPIGLIGFAVAAIGSVIMIVGIALHIVAASRQRRVVAQPVLPMYGASGLPHHHPY
jgi:pSer/pThr/pTyr-binding forkhead associated (FHA) protein